MTGTEHRTGRERERLGRLVRTGGGGVPDAAHLARDYDPLVQCMSRHIERGSLSRHGREEDTGMKRAYTWRRMER